MSVTFLFIILTILIFFVVFKFKGMKFAILLSLLLAVLYFILLKIITSSM